jgi:hypothetical protein
LIRLGLLSPVNLKSNRQATANRSNVSTIFLT